MIKKRFEAWCCICNKYIMKADCDSIKEFTDYLQYRGWNLDLGFHVCDKCHKDQIEHTKKIYNIGVGKNTIS